jgi:hypothetical protein
VTAFDPIVALNSLTNAMVEALGLVGKEVRSAHELGVGTATLTALSRHGMIQADRTGKPTLYFITPAGSAVLHALHAAVKPVAHVGEIERIQRYVADHYRVPPIEMISERRAKDVARPRQVAMWLCKRLTTKSLPVIGREFGGRDHTTVMHGVRKVEQLMGEDLSFEVEVKTLQLDLVSTKGRDPVDKPLFPTFASESMGA